LLVTDNPLYFEAHLVERFGNDLYLFTAWITVCDPAIPSAVLCAARARACRKTMAIVNATSVFRVPLIWMPYALRRRPKSPVRFSYRRGKQHQQGLVFGDEFYWPDSWMDTTLVRIPQQARSAERAHSRHLGKTLLFAMTISRHRPRAQGVTSSDSPFDHFCLAIGSCRRCQRTFVSNFQLAFSTYGDAINSIFAAHFLTHNFRGFSFNLAY